MVNQYGLIKQIKEYADKNNIPIITDEGISYITNYIIKHQIKQVLEIGTAIGYSAIKMALSYKDVEITSIERDEKRYLEALKNIKKLDLEDRIHLIYNDALLVNLKDKFDLIFIDAAKAQNIKFFEKFEHNLLPNGTIITDNIFFHGLVKKNEEEIESKNLKALVRKIKAYIEFLEKNSSFETQILEIGDGIAVSRRTKTEGD